MEIENLLVTYFDRPVDWFVCPVTKEKLTYKNGVLRSSRYSFAKNPNFGFWNFIPDDATTLFSEKWKTWSELQNNGVVSYDMDPTHNLGIGKRKDFLDFMEFCDFRGLVLDIGCGPQKLPTHFEFCTNKKVSFVGIDPLIGDQPKEYLFVRGLAEFLPFRPELFDQVLLVTSMDHFIDPVKSLVEAKNVLKKDGHIFIWIGEKKKNTPAPKESHEWYTSLKVPEGAKDKFHFSRLTHGKVESYLKQARLHTVIHETIIVDEWRTNNFYKVKK
jgi:SAM-dependent methyltransferase